MIALPDLSSGACAGMDTEAFFDAGYTAVTAAAKAVCWACPVKAECLGYALRVGVDGVWGGTTAQERVALRRRFHIDAIEVGSSADFTDPAPRDYSQRGAALTDDQVREARSRYDRGDVSSTKLAAEYGVSLTAMKKMLSRRSYGWVA